MNLAATLRENLADWTPAGDGRHTWSHKADDGWAVALTAERVESLGLSLWALALDGSARLDAVPLDDWAGRLAAEVTGLMEPLSVHEIDNTLGVALLRSGAPAQDAGAPLYYEVKLTAGVGLTLARYRHAAGGRREQVAFTLTHEAAAKFVGDAVAAAG